ncbi:MAG: SsrA-binding protein [Bacteroidetes bacterium]|jgi:SsrA-binding protein|nr:SsrA-binding protein SmpB [Bacteroidales bacterium]RLD58512.1 MAG: SsrA-binding protein [Bacteroidota bacterium]RLD95487.1 MAG: SsrA-binding protein [Bacteroidota bacterium]
MADKINIRNKKAYHNYEILEKYVAGIQLQGTEIKSIRMGKVSLGESYCLFENKELYVRGMQISDYAWGSFNKHIPGRDRKLLMTRHELKKLKRKTRESGLTIACLKLFLSDSGYAKLEIGLARGKREFDKRETIKRKDAQRQLDRLKKIK